MSASGTTVLPTRYYLLDAFERVFSGVQYRHRSSTVGDGVARFLFDDLLVLGRSAVYVSRVQAGSRVVNNQNRTIGRNARRGDGTFGEIVPNETPVANPGYQVLSGPIAVVEIGVESKILAKAMIKQIDRVMTDLRGQVTAFRNGGRSAITVAIVGVNFAPVCTSYEGDRAFTTTGRGGFLHPQQEAPEAIARLRQHVAPAFDEFVILEYEATNVPPYPFAWKDPQRVTREYSSALVRISREYDLRFS